MRIHRKRPITVWLVIGLLLAVTGPAEAQQPRRGPRVSGSVVGELRQGDRVTFTVTAVEPRGYRELNQIRITMLLRDVPLAELTYIEDANSIGIRGGSLLEVGVPGTLEGSFFRFNGLDVRTEASGTKLMVTVPARVLADVPPGADFRFTAVNDSGATGVVVRHLNIEEAGIGFGWGTVLLAVLLALFVGAFVGNLFASRRRVAPKVSVYGTIQRRLNEEPGVRR